MTRLLREFMGHGIENPFGPATSNGPDEPQLPSVAPAPLAHGEMEPEAEAVIRGDSTVQEL